MSDDAFTADGRCTCGAVRYRMNARPMFVHCCHCTWCQRESGSAFALNAMIETEHVELLEGAPQASQLPSASGRGQTVYRCPDCGVTLWSEYGMPGLSFVRVGTLEDPSVCPPDVQIYTSTRQPWVALPEDARIFAEYYNPKEEWPPASQARWKALKAS